MDETLVIALMLFHVLKKMPKSSFLLGSQLLTLSDSTRSTATSCISVGGYTSSVSMNVCFLPWFFFSPDRVTLSWSNSQRNGKYCFPVFPRLLSEPHNPQRLSNSLVRAALVLAEPYTESLQLTNLAGNDLGFWPQAFFYQSACCAKSAPRVHWVSEHE